MESPISVNFKLAYRGVDVHATKRDLDAKLKPYLENAKEAIDWALANGYEVPVKKSGFPQKVKEYIEGRTCPNDGGRLIKPGAGTKKPIKCENSKWNPTTKQAYGCTYIEWTNPRPDTITIGGATSREMNDYQG